MGDVFGEYSWQVRTYECGPDGLATMATICNYLQEAASLNAEALAFSKSDFEAAGENMTWVLARMKVKMERMPAWKNEIRILTYPRGGRRLSAWRDFIVYSGGSEIGRATSEWMIIDMATRRLAPIPEGVFSAANTVRPPVFGEPPAKLKWDCREVADAMRFKAKRGDIDLNGHVNNVHYVEWLVEGRSGAPCRELDIVFKSETLAGEEIIAEAVETEPGAYIHRLSSPDGRDRVLARTA